MVGPAFGNFMATGYTPGMGQSSGSSSFNVKRKRQSWTAEDAEAQVQKAMRCQSPKLDRRSTFPLHASGGTSGFVPDVNPGLSASASDADSVDQPMMDMDADMGGHAANANAQHGHAAGYGGGMDQDMDDGSGGYAGFDAPGQEGRMGMGYNFDDRGSGGFGFGPGCEEDEEEMESHATGLYPSLTPHTNPHHFSNQPAAGARATSPFAAAQAFSTTLRAPSPRGLMQPAAALPLSHDASEIEKARSQHGPNCKRIPKLVLSPYPDPATGERSMWTMCEDCGAVERAA